MATSNHDLVKEFPEFKDAIHELKLSDGHFRKLFDRYHDVDLAISRSEQRIDLRSEEDEEHLRKERVKIKDQLYQILLKTKG